MSAPSASASTTSDEDILGVVAGLIMDVFESSSTSDDDDDDDAIDDDDDELVIKLYERQKRLCRVRITGYVDVIQRYTDQEFKSHFRMSRATFEYILGIVGKDLMRKVSGCRAIPSRQQLMIAVWKMSTMDSYRSVCDRFNVGMATAVRAVRRVTNSLYSNCQKFIQWPSGDRAIAVMRAFEEVSGFPGIIGAIDGTHIRINAPSQNAADYINRKGFHSLQLQVVCDHRMLITHCYSGYPGSVHDQRVFRSSEVSDFLNDPEKFPSDSHLVGDAAYQLHERLLTPFRDNGHLTAGQNNYNYRLSAARVTVERCFGLLKGRMRSLLHCLPMSRVDLMARYIVACCVIHNLCILRNDDLDAFAISARDQGYAINHVQRIRNVAIQKRSRIMQMLQQ